MLYERLRLTADAIARDRDPVRHREHSAKLFRLMETRKITVRQWASLMATLLRPSSRERSDAALLDAHWETEATPMESGWDIKSWS